MKTICSLILALIVAVLILAVTGCTVTYSGGAWTAGTNGREIARAIQIMSEK